MNLRFPLDLVLGYIPSYSFDELTEDKFFYYLSWLNFGLACVMDCTIVIDGRKRYTRIKEILLRREKCPEVYRKWYWYSCYTLNNGTTPHDPCFPNYLKNKSSQSFINHFATNGFRLLFAVDGNCFIFVILYKM